MASVGRIELYTYCWTILRQVPYPLDQITIGFFDIIKVVSVKNISFAFSKIFKIKISRCCVQLELKEIIFNDQFLTLIRYLTNFIEFLAVVS